MALGSKRLDTPGLVALLSRCTNLARLELYAKINHEKLSQKHNKDNKYIKNVLPEKKLLAFS